MLLLIPVENQVRELDPKLLLACVAARSGFASVVGSRRELEFHIDRYPRSIYLSKSMTGRSRLFFRIARKFGHDIVAWDEEALVHLPPEIYYSRRLHPEAIRQVSTLFAWGEDNVRLWRGYPRLPGGMPIHATGNPRNDMLRRRMHPFYREQVEALRKTYGDFILVNTNFNHVNAFGADMNLFRPAKKPGQPPAFGRAAKGMTRAYAQGLSDHKQAVFDSFQRIIPKLDQAFPDCRVVVRPHPTERHEVYRRIAARCARVTVTNEGNVVPWILAARAVVHNGCTTGVEAFVMGVPSITYQEAVSDTYDNGFYRLPNAVSHRCADFEELAQTLGRVMDGRLGPLPGDGPKALVDRCLTAQSGPLACERMVEVLKDLAAGREDASRTVPPKNRLERRAIAAGYHLYRRMKPWLPGSHNRPAFQRHRYPPVSTEALADKIRRIQDILGDDTRLSIERMSDVLFRISP